MSNVSTKALRYYEAIGLVQPATRTPAGYRLYGGDAPERVAFIKSAQGLGFTLDEIAEIIAIREAGGTPCSRVLELIRRRVSDIERKIVELDALKGALERRVLMGEDLDPSHCASAVCDILVGSPDRVRRSNSGR